MIETNKEYAKNNTQFKQCCMFSECEPTKRQASKFRRKIGKAFFIGLELLKEDQQKEKNKALDILEGKEVTQCKN